MAHPKHLARLKEDVPTWNRWRMEHPIIQPFLSGADLSRTRLYGADLSRALLSGANLSRANLSGANLKRADLNGANLNGANLTNTDLSYATVGGTHFDDLDLRTVKGLETVTHHYPSPVSITTIYRSEGLIPETFLQKAGVPEDFLTYMHSLVACPIEYYTCFISYASQDDAFAKRLYTDLQASGVRCWFAPEHMKTGDKIRNRIDESIRLYDKLLLVLSASSVQSDWVEFEVERAFAKEQSKKALVVFPVRLDAAVKECETSWATHLYQTRHITDFTKWKQHDDYQQALARLLRDLQPEKPPGAKQA